MKKLILMLAVMMSISVFASASDIGVSIDNKTIEFDVNPIIKNDRVMVPLRKIFETLGAKVTWDDSQKKVTAVKENTTLTLYINKSIMYNNNTPIVLDVAPMIVNDRTLVPIRAVSESFDADVVWENNWVIITTNKVQNSFEQEVLDLVNQERQKAGLSKLQWSDDLAKVAYNHSKDMSDRNFMSHTNPDGLSPFDRMKNFGISYRTAGENIAAGQSTPQEVMKGWMNSEGHKKNILNANYTHLGVGYYKGNGRYGHYWTQCFIGK